MGGGGVKSVGRGDFEYSKEENSKTFFPITSKNSASGESVVVQGYGILKQILELKIF